MTKKSILKSVMATILITSFTVGCGFSGKQATPTKTPETSTSVDEKTKETEEAPVANTNDTITVYDTNEIRTLVQWAASDTNSFTILNNAFEGLYRLDPEHNPIPALATGYTVSDDKLVYTFTLRDNLTWSDGTPITANDFVFSWLKQMTVDATNNYSFIMTDYILNGEEYFNGTAKAEDVGVKATDDKTLVVTLKSPTPYFLRLTTLTMYFPLSEKFVTAQGTNYGLNAENMIYSGPYAIKTYDPAIGSTLVKNEKYWDATNVKVANVNVKIIKDQSTALNAYKAGELSKVTLSSIDVAAYKADPEFVAESEFRTTYIQYNTKSKELTNTNIRNALTIAVNRDVLADVILADGSVPAYGMIAPKMSGHNDKSFRELNGNLYSFDAKKAKELWDKGVAELGGVAPQLTLLTADDSLTKTIATYVQSEFKTNLGIDVKIDSKTLKARNELMDNNNYQMAITGWGADYDDAMTYLDLWTNGTPYRGNYMNEAYNKLIADAKKETNDEVRIQMLLDAEKMLVNTDLVVSPLYCRGFAYLQKSNIKNLVTHPFGSPIEFKFASFE